jgi:hypothetical protein
LPLFVRVDLISHRAEKYAGKLFVINFKVAARFAGENFAGMRRNYFVTFRRFRF